MRLQMFHIYRKNNNYTMQGPLVDDPMDVDPIDDGPIPTRRNSATALVASTSSEHFSSGQNLRTVDDAKTAIDMLRSDDLSNRIVAAHKLDTIAKALGPERTREVRHTITVN